MRKILLLIAISCLLQRTQAQPILPEREQSRVVDELLEERFNTVLPQLMQRTNIDLWLVISREYNEDPILKTMLPSTWLSAIAEGFSNRVINPGVTTTDDLVWWFRQRVTSLGLTTWFHPSVSVQRSDTVNFEHLRSFSNRPENDVILPGDLLHVDFGITYLRLNTDIQQHAYVLRPGEIEAPAYLKKAFATSNRLQDILTSQFKTGITGNNILKAAREQAIKEGIKPSIYTHPLGLHGHAAGPTIGLWDKQEGVPGSGDYPVFPHTAYSIELNSSTFIAEWGKEIRIMLEEDGYFDGQNFRYIAGRQEKLRLISYF